VLPSLNRADDRAGPTHLNTEVTGATEATTAPQDRSCSQWRRWGILASV